MHHEDRRNGKEKVSDSRIGDSSGSIDVDDGIGSRQHKTRRGEPEPEHTGSGGGWGQQQQQQLFIRFIIQLQKPFQEPEQIGRFIRHQCGKPCIGGNTAGKSERRADGSIQPYPGSGNG